MRIDPKIPFYVLSFVFCISTSKTLHLGFVLPGENAEQQDTVVIKTDEGVPWHVQINLEDTGSIPNSGTTISFCADQGAYACPSHYTITPSPDYSSAYSSGTGASEVGSSGNPVTVTLHFTYLLTSNANGLTAGVHSWKINYRLCDQGGPNPCP